MFKWARKVIDKLNEPTGWDAVGAALEKTAPERRRREIFNDPMVSREELLKQRIWVDAQGNRILFEHMDVQRLLNILIWKSTRGYKQYLREYFGKMIGVASSYEYYRVGLSWAGERTKDKADIDPTTRAILQELVSRGIEFLEEEPFDDPLMDPFE